MISSKEKSPLTGEAGVRLTGLLNYVEQLIRLDEQTIFSLNEHRLPTGQTFIIHQHEFHALPGVTHDLEDDDGPVWLSFGRLRRSNAPPAPEAISEWLVISNDPDETPKLKDCLFKTVTEHEKESLLAPGDVRPEDCAEAMGDNKLGRYEVRFRLEDRPNIREATNDYLASTWLPWADSERPVRKSIGLYQKFFELAQLNEISVDHPVELVIGVGVSRWIRDGREIDLPLIERLAEIEIDESDGRIKIRPRSAPAFLNLRPYEELKIDGAALAQDAARRALAAIVDDFGVSPFRAETFEPALRACQSHLDTEARYLPDGNRLGASEPLPVGTAHLCVSDRWVAFARRRSENFLLKDLEELKRSIANATPNLPGPATTLAMGPGDEDRRHDIGMRSIIGSRIEPIEAFEDEAPLGDIFFPKPFNDEQVQIVRRLEKEDGVVVQGPPGTGKTHTISNIICHYLATGRRVLVVSHGEAALAVLRDKLPERVRDLAISVTSSERDGLKQIETAARLLQSIVQDLNVTAQMRVITDIESAIVTKRDQLRSIDSEIAAIARTHLSIAPGTALLPAQLAQSIVEQKARFDWFVDRPSQFAKEVNFGDADISTLREARRALGKRLEFVGAKLPAIQDLPDAATVARWHEDILAAARYAESAMRDQAFIVQIISRDALEMAERAIHVLENMASIRHRATQTDWLWRLAVSSLQGCQSASLAPILLAFHDDAQRILDRHDTFLHRPVDVPEGLTDIPHAVAIITRLAEGEAVFGFFTFAANSHRVEIEKSRVGGRSPAVPPDWTQVRDYIFWRQDVAEIDRRWRALAAEFGAAPIDATSIAALRALVDDLRCALVEASEANGAIAELLPQLVHGAPAVRMLWEDRECAETLRKAIVDAVAATRLSASKMEVSRIAALFDPETSGKIGEIARTILESAIGQPTVVPHAIASAWDNVLRSVDDIAQRSRFFDSVRDASNRIAKAGAPKWAARILSQPAPPDADELTPSDWREAWDWGASQACLARIDQREKLRSLSERRVNLERELAQAFEHLVRERAFYALARQMTGKVKAALMMFATALRKVGGGTGKGAARHRRAARDAMAQCYDAIPCWIMPSWRVAEQLPGEIGSFDLVIMDEASQAEIREIAALLRGKKILVVGDDKQVSPMAAFIENSKIEQLERSYLRSQPYRTLLLPGASLYDLAKVMFPNQFVMLREHFRCVEPIIRFSMQFYHPEPLVPLRVSTSLERLDPPLVDIYVPDGRRTADKINKREAEVIVEEIRRIIDDPKLARIDALDRWRSIGVISLIGAKQAHLVNKMLLDEIGEESMLRHRIVCGDSATFQGNEKDIVFLSLVADRQRKQAQTAEHFAQRFNVALSRARDRMVLVRSVSLDELKQNDLKAKVLRHFADPMVASERGPMRAADSRSLLEKCDSDFERNVFEKLVALGYRVTPQVGSQGYSIDLVVEGEGDKRLAIECDGDKYHGPERWADDMRRQRILERVGWKFWRCFASSFTLDPEGCMADLVATLTHNGIGPGGATPSPSDYVQHRTVATSSVKQADTNIEENKTTEPSPMKHPGIRVGDRVLVRYLDDNRTASYTLSSERGDELTGLLWTGSPLGRELLGLAEEDEAEFDLGGAKRRVMVVRTEQINRGAPLTLV